MNSKFDRYDLKYSASHSTFQSSNASRVPINEQNIPIFYLEQQQNPNLFSFAKIQQSTKRRRIFPEKTRKAESYKPRLAINNQYNKENSTPLTLLQYTKSKKLNNQLKIAGKVQNLTTELIYLRKQIEDQINKQQQWEEKVRKTFEAENQQMNRKRQMLHKQTQDLMLFKQKQILYQNQIRRLHHQLAINKGNSEVAKFNMYLCEQTGSNNCTYQNKKPQKCLSKATSLGYLQSKGYDYRS